MYYKCKLIICKDYSKNKKYDKNLWLETNIKYRQKWLEREYKHRIVGHKKSDDNLKEWLGIRAEKYRPLVREERKQLIESTRKSGLNC